MNFVHYDLGQLRLGQTVEVSLSHAANVLLLNTSNFNAYSRGANYNYYGGWVTQSPYRLAIPTADHWHIAIDLGGAAGQLRSTVHVFG